MRRVQRHDGRTRRKRLDEHEALRLARARKSESVRGGIRIGQRRAGEFARERRTRGDAEFPGAPFQLRPMRPIPDDHEPSFGRAHEREGGERQFHVFFAAEASDGEQHFLVLRDAEAEAQSLAAASAREGRYVDSARHDDDTAAHPEHAQTPFHRFRRHDHDVGAIGIRTR